MAIDAEPKDGDFARYIENLTRAGGTTPGKVPPKREAARRAPDAAPPPAPASAEPLSTAPWGKSAPPSRPAPAASPSAAPSPGQEDPGAESLARRARQRKIGIVLTVAGVLAGWAAVRIAVDVLVNRRADLDELMPALFLAFFAFMLFKAARGARNPRGAPLGKLPPLKRSSYRKDGGA